MLLDQPLDRKILFYADVTQETIGEVTHAILSIQDHDERLRKSAHLDGHVYNPKPMELYISTYGGDAYACLGLVSIIANCTTPVHTYVTGCAMSAGFIMAIAGHKRFCYKNSTYMWHQLSSVSAGKIQERDEGMVEDTRVQKLLDYAVLKYTNLSKKDLDKLYKTKQDKYLSSEEALAMGAVDEII